MFHPIGGGNNQRDEAGTPVTTNSNLSNDVTNHSHSSNPSFGGGGGFSFDQALGTTSVPAPPGMARGDSDRKLGATSRLSTSDLVSEVPITEPTALGTTSVPVPPSMAHGDSDRKIGATSRLNTSDLVSEVPVAEPVDKPNNTDPMIAPNIIEDPPLKPGAFDYITPKRRMQQNALAESGNRFPAPPPPTAPGVPPSPKVPPPPAANDSTRFTAPTGNTPKGNGNQTLPAAATDRTSLSPDKSSAASTARSGGSDGGCCKRNRKLILGASVLAVLVFLALIGLVVWLFVEREQKETNPIVSVPVPTPSPTMMSTPAPTSAPPPPTMAPTLRRPPTPMPIAPTLAPTQAPITPAPSASPSIMPTTPMPTTPLVTDEPTVSPTTMEPTVNVGGSLTLAQIQSRGSLRCGIFQDQPGFSSSGSTDSTSYQGFEADLCRALGAAALGRTSDTNNNVEFVPVTTSERFEALATGRVDVLASLASHTMERDVFENQAQAGFTFSTPYLYSGLAFGGRRPPFGDCADRLDTTGNCTGIRICVEDGTTFVNRVVELMPNASVSTLPGLDALYNAFRQDFCDAIAGDLFEVADSVLRSRGYTQEYELGSNTYSREPNALVTRDDDPRWSDFVNWVLQSLLAAEEQGITQEFAEAFTKTTFFGNSFETLFVDAIATVGNYAEMYERHLQDILPRTQVNNINKGTSGLILSLPFGDISNAGPGPIPGGTLARIRERGHLRCGITRFPGFGEFVGGEWIGLDVDYCRAISAAIFNGVSNTVVFQVLPATERFQALASGDVDLLSRITTWTFERDVDLGFSFSQPNFYDGVAFGGIPPYGRCADNRDTISSECSDLKICVNDGTTTIQRVRDFYADRFIVPKPTGETAILGLNTGECNAVAGSVLQIVPGSVANIGYTGPYETGSNRFSKEPLALVTREDDAQFTAFVNWIVSASFFAEEESIGQANANSMPEVAVFGPLYRRMLIDAIQAVGNYREIYARNVEDILPRAGLNSANRNPLGAQHYPLPGI